MSLPAITLLHVGVVGYVDNTNIISQLTGSESQESSDEVIAP
jgi:hypothetical protein